MKQYPLEHKKAVVQKWMHSDLSLRQFAKEEGIGVSTLYDWKSKYLDESDGEIVLPKNNSKGSWLSEQKFAVVLETATMSEAELSGV